MNKKLGKNIILNIVYQILTLVFPFITTPYVARILGANNIGIYTYGHSIAAYFVMFSILGMRNYGSRTIAEVRDDVNKRSILFSELFTLQLFTSFISLLFYSLYLLLFCKTNISIAIIFGIYVFSTILDCSWFFTGICNFKSIVYRGILVKLLNLILVFVIVKSKNDLMIYTLIFALGELIGQLSLWPSLRKYLSFLRIRIKGIKKHLKQNLLLFIPILATCVFQMTDKIMIGSFSSMSNLAYYEYADKFISIPNVLSTAIGTVMLSHMSYEMKNGKSNYKKTIKDVIDLTFLICVPCTFGLVAISSELVNVYYGIEYMQSSLLIKCLSPVILLYGLSNVIRMQYIIPKRKEKLYISSTIVAAVINLVINFVLIPMYSSLGAAIGTITANAIVLLIFIISLRKELSIQYFCFKNIPIIIIGLLMYIITSFCQLYHSQNLEGLIIDIIIGIFVYIILIILYSKFNKDNLLANINKYIRNGGTK